MEMKFANRGTEKYVEVCVGKGSFDVLGEQYNQYKMLENCDIPFLVKPMNCFLDGSIYLKYNVTGMYILSRWVELKTCNLSFVQRLMRKLKECVLELEKYMLCPDDLVLTLEYIMCDFECSNVKFIYIPGYSKRFSLQLKELLEKIMTCFDHSDYSGVMYVHGLYDMVVSDTFAVSDMDSERICKSQESNIEYENSSKKIFNATNESEIEDKYFNDKIYNKADSKIERKTEKKETTKICLVVVLIFALIVFAVRFFLFGGSKTDAYIVIGLIVGLIGSIIFLSAEDNEDEDMAMYEYVREKQSFEELNFDVPGKIVQRDLPSEKITLMDKPRLYGAENYTGKAVEKKTAPLKGLMPLGNGVLKELSFSDYSKGITFGRGKENVDYQLLTTQVSRVHAKVFLEGDEVFVEDANSTNGTFVNSKRIPSNKMVRLKQGDILRFADEDFLVM